MPYIVTLCKMHAAVKIILGFVIGALIGLLLVGMGAAAGNKVETKHLLGFTLGIGGAGALVGGVAALLLRDEQ